MDTRDPRERGFPAGEYTPFGYLRNPFQRASGAWEHLEGGNLRSCDETMGMEWAYPWHRSPSAVVGLSIVCDGDERSCVTRADYEAIGYTSRYHSANVFGYDWSFAELQFRARYVLDGDTLCVQITIANPGSTPAHCSVSIVAHASVTGSTVDVTSRDAVLSLRSKSIADSSVPECHALAGADGMNDAAGSIERFPLPAGARLARLSQPVSLEPGESLTVSAALSREADEATTVARAREAVGRVDTALTQAFLEDERFYRTCPTLSGDWPSGWREGMVYDIETTRLCVMPAGGIFHDVWPSWMTGWPRVVVAEGTLDMLRLSYADPQLAQRALLTLFRDAPAANVPCVFEDGSPNMVASDGSVCGTSPAWCLPFLNLELLYLRTLDRGWLSTIYPLLGKYIEWWLEHRADSEGWIVYKCTWEAGEDGNHRLDPTGSGNADISHRIRPVELQASLAYAARVLAFFADELGKPQDARRWGVVFDSYQDRTRKLFDSETARFRDWLIEEDCFQDEQQLESYWGANSRRYSALSLTPALGDVATESQRALLKTEIESHSGAPWTSWPSWCHVLTECAAAVGSHQLAGDIAWGVLDRVYRLNNRRSLEGVARPTPGVSPEYWPADFRTWSASDAYGWGATTMNLLLRHLMGLQESTETLGWVLRLAPGIPEALQVHDARYTVRDFNYRGRRVTITYRWEGRTIRVNLELQEAAQCTVSAEGLEQGLTYQSRRPDREHSFHIDNGARHRLALVF